MDIRCRNLGVGCWCFGVLVASGLHGHSLNSSSEGRAIDIDRHLIF